MRYGYFDDKNREYVISQPDTPQPWINYLGCENYFGLISNTGGGYSFFKDARLMRLTRYRYNNVPMDEGGRYLFLRDNESGSYWSPTWQPTRTELDSYECRHGMGYTKIKSSLYGIQSKVRYFVPLGDNLEIWQCEIENNRSTPVDLSMFSYVEFCLWDANDDATNYQRNLNIGEVEVHNNVIYHKTEYRERRNHYAYFACSDPIDGFDTQRKNFVGLYNGLHEPQVVVAGESQNSVAHGWFPIGSHHLKLKLQPGEKRTILFVLGVMETESSEKFSKEDPLAINREPMKPILAKYLDESKVEKAFQDLKEYWSEILDFYTVDTPSEHVNRMVNIWNPYQNMVTFNLSRSASYFESGIGRGMGFRDSNQDLLGFVQFSPERARERILDLAATQLEDGSAYHQYQPLTKRGNDAVGSNFNDDPLWLVLAVAAYLKETRDWDILKEQVPFNNQPGSEVALYVHLQRSIQNIQDHRGPHGLPLIGRADWNDCLNLNCFSDTPGESFQTTTMREGNVAESTFIAGLYVKALSEMIELSGRLGKQDDQAMYEKDSQAMIAVINEHGWDGDWFLRAYDAFSRPLGSKFNEEGKIFIEPQGMCVMAGVGIKDGKAKRALDAVERYLSTEHGIVLLQPPFQQYHLHLGEVSSYPPGYKENASVFCHTNPWIMIAETLIDRPEKALEYYLKINPSAREAISEKHGAEPYVYAQTIAGKDAPSFGEAKNSWLSGTASYNYVAITQHILGIRADWDGLRVQPVVPREWKSFSATRKYQGVTYRIAVNRRGNGSQVELIVDGKKQTGMVIPYDKEAAGVVEVEVNIY